VSEPSGGLAGLRFRRLHEGTRIRSAVGQPIIDRLYDIWDRRDVLRMLIERGLRHKYARSVLGYAWSMLEPAAFVLTYFILLKIFNRSYPMYTLFIGSAILPWQWFSSVVNSSTSTLRKNSRLITSIALPREIYPLAEVGMKTVEFALSLPVLVIVALIYRAKPTAYLAVWPLALLFQLMLCVGIALLVSSLNTVLRDIEQGINIVIRMLFFLSPILYPLSKLTPPMQHLASLNPMVGILAINRAVWLPAYWTGWTPVLYSAAGATLFLLLGFTVFARVERAVLKEL
jgi:ABC-2 type transport system permease protein